MNPFTVFSPFALLVFGAAALTIILAPFVVIAGGVLALLMYTDWSSKNKTVEYKYILGMNRHRMTTLLTILCAVLAFACYSILFLSCSGPWLRARPSPDWQEGMKKADTAIILGFGIEQDDQGNLLAGNANHFLLEWTLKKTAAKTLLVQEGIRLAAVEMQEKGPKPVQRDLVMIHPHKETNYVNTLQAAYYSLKKMGELGKSRAVLVAHDLQMQRAYWDLAKIKKSRPEWKDIEIIVPRVPQTPFPGHSLHWHTRGGLRYRLSELFYSRPRDYLASMKSFQ
jgi:uncharacterized SAM-binding protein YcdF (DUF218 family)